MRVSHLDLKYIVYVDIVNSYNEWVPHWMTWCNGDVRSRQEVQRDILCSA